MSLFSVAFASPFLFAEFPQPQSMLSWSLTKPGFVRAKRVAWLQVYDADLPLGVDPARLLASRMAEAGHADAVQLMTSRDLQWHHMEVALSGTIAAACLATVGLSNASRIGEMTDHECVAGTINLLAHVDQPLSQAALVEALSIATEARTAAIIDLGLRRNGKIVTGTGTDCIVMAAPEGGDPSQFAGLHTDVGTAIGRAVYDAVRRGGEAWITSNRM